MRILLLSQFYWPETRSAPQNLAAVAEALQDKGHEVVVLTGFPNHPLGRVYEGYRRRWRQWEVVRGVRVLRLPLFVDHSLSAWRRALHYGSFAASAATIGLWSTRRFDPHVLLVYLPPVTNWLPARLLSLLHGIPVVFWETDLWPEALEAVGAAPPPWVASAIRRLSQAAHALGARIALNSPGLASKLREQGVPAERLEVITDWAEESLFFPSEPDPELAAEHGLAGRFNILYGGTLGPAQGLETVLEAAARLRGVEGLQFVLVGGGEDEERLRSLARDRSLANLRFIPRQPIEAMHRFFALADGLLAHLRPSPLFERQIPSKIMAYMACGRPILCAMAGSAAEVVEAAGAGICCPPGDPEALAEAVMRFYRLAPAQRRAMGESGRAAYLERFTRAVQTRRFETLLQAAAREGRPARLAVAGGRDSIRR